MKHLSEKRCKPCKGGIPKLTGDEAKIYFTGISNWSLIEDHHIEKSFLFPDFKQALQFVNLVGDIAEDENHHPEIILSWGKVLVSIWTHKIDGLHKNDFILAAKIDKL